MAPAQPQQIIAHGLGQIAHVAIGLDRQRAMALGKLCAVRAVDQRQMAIDRHRPAHRLDDLQLARGIVEMIGAADHMGHAHVVIVHHHRQHVGGRAVASAAAPCRRAGRWRSAHRPAPGHARWSRRLRAPSAAPQRARPAALRTDRGRASARHSAWACRPRFCASRISVEFFRRGIAAIGLALRPAAARPLRDGGRRGRIDRSPRRPNSAPSSPCRSGSRPPLRGGAFAVGILDAQQEGAAGVAGIEPVEQGGARAADMQHACGRGRKAQDRFCVLRSWWRPFSKRTSVRTGLVSQLRRWGSPRLDLAACVRFAGRSAALAERASLAACGCRWRWARARRFISPCRSSRRAWRAGRRRSLVAGVGMAGAFGATGIGAVRAGAAGGAGIGLCRRQVAGRACGGAGPDPHRS